MAWNDAAQIECRFRFTCPRLWSALEPTDAPAIRFCPECRRDVFLALTEETFGHHAALRRCVAFPLGSSTDGDWEGLPIDFLIGEPGPRYPVDP